MIDPRELLGSELRRRPPVENIVFDLLENGQLDEEHHERKEKCPREDLGHVEKLEPVVQLKADPGVLPGARQPR